MSDGYDEYRRGLLLLSQGEYKKGFELYEQRRFGTTPVVDPLKIWPNLGLEWNGQNIDGKHVLVFGEQGFGDQIMFARFIPTLQSLGASATFVCGAGLERLFPNSHTARRKHDFPPAHYWALVGSLPHKLSITLDTLPPPYPIHYNTREHRGGIGVVPSGRPSHTNDSHRSLDESSARRLLNIGRDLRPEATGARDFAETASLISELDLIITVDTAIAHLSASMGKETWILIPRIETDWRWLTTRTDSPWYPNTRLYRQHSDWSNTLDSVIHDLLGRSKNLDLREDNY